MRILEITYRYGEELRRLLLDASTPPVDRADVYEALQILDGNENPRDVLRDVRERPGLLEYVISASSSGHEYGVVLIDMGHVADGVAYWREPPIVIDETTGSSRFDRADAVRVASERMEDLR